MDRQYWWQRDDLSYHNNELTFNGQSVSELGRQFGTPSFFYNPHRVQENIQRIKSALDKKGLTGRHKIYYAMKANRFMPLLTILKESGLCGIDACSPDEVDHAISCGFKGEDISFTATSLSTGDLERLSRIDGMHINCDSQDAVRRWGQMGPGRTIGLRINPALGVGRTGNTKLHYSGSETTKFGIYREQFQETLEIASKHNLKVTKIHFHTGCGYLNEQLDQLKKILETSSWFTDQLSDLKAVNIGGGLGVPHIAGDRPLDLDRWSAILADHFRDKPFQLEVEPGDFLVKDSGILVLTMNYLEQKRDTLFAFVDAGFNIALEPAVYSLPFEPLPALLRKGPAKKVTIAGNINEALDIFYRDITLPPMDNGDILCLINAGAYSTSMASNHCLRGYFREYLLR